MTTKRNFTTKAFLRHAPNRLLRQFFEKREELANFDWKSLKTESQIEPLYEAMLQMPDASRQVVEGIFRQINNLSHQAGIETLLGEAEHQLLDLRPAFDQMKGFEEKGLWTQIHHEKVVRVAGYFQHADFLNTGSWKTRTGIPGIVPLVLPDDLKRLEQELSKFYLAKEGRGKHCKAENYLRNRRFHYYFVYLQDFGEIYTGYDTKGEFERKMHQPAFEVVFRYDDKDGVLETFAKGTKDFVESVQEMFCKTILQCDLPPASISEEPYSLKRLFELNFDLVTEPVDRLDHARVRKIRLNVRNYVTRRILLESLNDGEVLEIKDMFYDYLNNERMNPNLVKISWAEFEFEFLPVEGQKRGKKVVFQLTDAGHTNLEQQTEEHRALIERYLKRWKIFRV